MSKLTSLFDQYNADQGDLLLKFATERNLPIDVDLWPEKDQLEWFDASDALTEKLDKAIEELVSVDLDKRESDDWYKIDITLDTADGPEYETIDVREVSLEKLSNICKMFPKYNEYYFEKVAKSL